MQETGGIVGFKGGKEARTPIEAPDSLYSTSMARIVDLLSEGDLEMWVSDNPLKDVFLDGTPVMNIDGTLNFQSVQVDWRPGSPDQTFIPGFPSVKSEVAVGIELTQATPWVRSITNTQLSAISLRLATPALTKTDNTNGDTLGYKIDYGIDLSTDNGAFVEVFKGTMAGKTKTKYERGHRIDLPPATTGWQVRIRRVSPDSSTQYIQDKLQVLAITEIIDAKLRYPYSALVAIALDAKQFRSIPQRAYRVKGRVIRVPTNYNAVTRVYTGVWDGTFKLSWTNNPAWIYYDMATNKRYGLGRRINESRIDKWSLFKIAQYCDELVPNGKGGTEPRFTCTAYLQTKADAYKVMQDLASVFRGISYWAGGSIVGLADQPDDPVFTYTNANVRDGKFTYNGTGKKARHTMAMVAWTNLDNFGKGEVATVIDEEGIIRYGIQPTQVTAFGATSESQAQRVGRWIMASELLETDTCTWDVGLDGTLVAPGKIVRVFDRDRAGRRLGGRVSSAGANFIIIDAMPAVLPVAGDKLFTINAQGTAQESLVQSVDAAAKKITVTANFVGAVVPHSVWGLEAADLAPQLFRILGVTDNNDGTYGIAALQHEPGKFAQVEQGVLVEAKPTRVLPTATVAAPTAVTITSSERAGQVVAGITVNADWQVVAGATAYFIQWKRGDGEWSPPQKLVGTNTDLANSFAGDHWARVWSVNQSGVTSPIRLSNKLTVADQTLKPGFVAALNTDIAAALTAANNAQATADGAILSFWQTTPPVIGSAAGQASVGDIWFDTDDGNKVYRVVGTAWVRADDDRMAQAIGAASTAQATADGKVKTFFQATAPTATGLGDLWFNTTASVQKLFRWNGTTWADNVGDVTLAQLAGNGTNIIPDDISTPTATGLPPIDVNIGGTLTRDTSVSYLGVASYKMVSTTTDEYHRFTGYIIPMIGGRKYVLSMYVNSSVAGAGMQAYFDAVNGDTLFVNLSVAGAAGVWSRVSCLVDLTGLTAIAWRMRVDNHEAASVTTYVDALMLEPQVGTLTTPSTYVRGPILKLDGINDGLLYSKPLGTRIDAGRPVMDFNDGIHYNKNLDFIGDGGTYSRPLATRINAGKPFIDFSEVSNLNKNIDNVADGSSFSRTTAARVNAGKPVVDLSETIHFNKNLDNVADGGTYSRPLGSRVNAGRPVIDFTDAIHYNKNADNLSETAGRKWAGESGADVTGNKILLHVRDPSFELPAFGSEWSGAYRTQVPQFYLQSPGFTGSQELVRAPGGDSIDGLYNINAKMPAKAGGRYRIRCAVKGDGNGVMHYGLAWYDSNGGYLGGAWNQDTPAAEQITPIPGVWREYSRAETAPVGTAFARVAFSIINHTTGYYEIDSFGATEEVTDLDSVNDGVTYSKPLGSRVNAGRPVMDFNDGIHYNKNLDYVADGGTYSRPLATRINEGKPVTDFSEGIHFNKNLDYIGDGGTYSRPLGTRVNAGRPVMDFNDGIHYNKNLDYLGDGGTYARPLGSRLSAGKPVVDFSEAIHFNKNADYLAESGTRKWAAETGADVTAFTVNGNVLNPGFEKGMTNWQDAVGGGGSRYAEASSPFEGTTRCVLTGATNVGIFNDKYIPCVPGDIVRVKAKFNTTGGLVGKMAAHVYWYNSAGSYLGGSYTDKDAVIGSAWGTSWKDYTNFVEAPANAAFGRFAVSLFQWSAGYMLVDACQADLIPNSASGVNLLADSDYARGGVGSGGGVGITTEANGMKYGYVNSLADNVYAFPFIETDRVTIIAGEKYSAQFEVMPVGISGLSQMSLQLRFFDAAYTQLVADGSSVVYNAADMVSGVYKTLRVDGMAAPAGTTTIRLILFLRGTATQYRYRKAKLEKSSVCTPYNPSFDATWGTELTVPNSGRRIGDQRNLLQIQVTSLGAKVNASISYTAAAGSPATATISVGAFNVLMGSVSIGYLASSVAVTGTSGTTTTFYLYRDDPGFDGGPTGALGVSTNGLDMYANDARLFIGAVDVAFPASGTTSATPPSSGGGPSCVTADMVLLGDMMACEVKQGTVIDCLNLPDSPMPFKRRIDAIEFSDGECVRITTEYGAVLDCASSTPFDLLDGRVKFAPHMLGELVVTDRGVQLVASVEALGVRPICHIHVGGVSYAAGRDGTHRIYSHNPLKP